MIKEFINQTPIEIAQYCNLKDLKKAISYLYHKSWCKPLLKILTKIKKTKTKKHKDPEEFLEVKCAGFLDKNTEEFKRFYVIQTNKYSLSFRKWNELANIPFDENTLRRYTPEELIAHFLKEITWYGNEKKSIKLGKKLNKQVIKIKKELTKQKKHK